MKFSDIYNRANKKNPHLELDIELHGEEVTLLLRNVIRLAEEDAKELGDCFEALQENASEDVLTEEEKNSTAMKVLVGRFTRALRATADDKELYDEFIKGLRDKHGPDFNIIMIELFAAYGEETRLGEAESSGNS